MTRKDITMLRHLALGLAAATLVATLHPGDALAHHGGHRHRAVHHGYGWGPDPRASIAGYQGPHYGRNCYRAASGRAICPVIYREL